MSRWRTAEQRADANRAALDTWHRNGPEPPEPEIKDMSTGTTRERCQAPGCRELTFGDWCFRHDSQGAMYGQ